MILKNKLTMRSALTTIILLQLISVVSANPTFNKLSTFGGTASTKELGYRINVDDSGVVTSGSVMSNSQYIFPSENPNDGFRFMINKPYIRFSGIRLNLAQSINNTDFNVTWYYHYGHAYGENWYPLEITGDTCGKFNQTGYCEVNWSIPRDFSEFRPSASTGSVSGYSVEAVFTNFSSSSYSRGLIYANSQFYDYSIEVDDGNVYGLGNLFVYNFNFSGNPILTRDLVTKEYILNASLVISDGTVKIRDGQTLVIGEENEYTKNHAQLMVLTDNGVLQLGEKDGIRGYRGGQLILKNGWYYGKYNYMTGHVYCYASTFRKYSYGYTGMILSGDNEYYDCQLVSVASSDVWDFSGGTHYFYNSELHTYYLYVYTPNFFLVNTQHLKGDAGVAYAMLDGAGSYLVKADGLEFINGNGVIATQQAGIQLINPVDLDASEVTLSGNYGIIESVLETYSFELTITDKDNNPLENVSVSLVDKNGNEALTKNLRLANSQSSLVLTNLDSTTDTTGHFYNNSDYYRPTVPASDYLKVGDKMWVRSELMQVTGFSGDDFVVDRNIFGSNNNGYLGGLHEARLVNDSVLTDSNGQIYPYSGTPYYVTENDYSRVSNVDNSADMNPYTLTLSKEGYQTITYTFNVTEPMDWTVPLEESTPTPTVNPLVEKNDYTWLLVMTVFFCLSILITYFGLITITGGRK